MTPIIIFVLVGPAFIKCVPVDSWMYVMFLFLHNEYHHHMILPQSYLNFTHQNYYHHRRFEDPYLYELYTLQIQSYIQKSINRL